MQKHLCDQIAKLQQSIVNNQSEFEKKIKRNGEEVRQNLMRINEKERGIKEINEKQTSLMVQHTRTQKKYEELKKELD